MFQIEPQSSKRPKFSEPLPNRKTHHKTEPCLKFQRGSCNYGDRCCFAHCIKQNEVIHIPIQNVPIAVDEKTNPRCNERTRFCWRYMSGERCQYGEKCHFIHVKSDGENDEMVNRKVLRWRTKICFRWMMTGSCRYGSSCCYAHGESELQNQGLDDVHNYAEGGPCRLVDDKGGKQLKVKWKNYEKISRAYADWINDLPLVSHTI